MPEFEVGVRAFDHYTVEAESAEEAGQKAVDEAQSDLPIGWNVDDAHAGGPLDA